MNSNHRLSEMSGHATHIFYAHVSKIQTLTKDRVPQSLVSCVVLCISLDVPLSFSPSDHCGVCPPIYDF